MFDWELHDPWFLLIALLAPVVFWWLRRPNSTVQYSSLELLDQTPLTWRTRAGWMPSLLVSLAVVALAVALARPRTPNDQTRVSSEGIAIMMVVDRSGSMNARDLVKDDTSVDRLTVVKDVFSRFVLGDGTIGSGRSDDMIGLVSFAGYADSICPLTSDHRNLVALADQLTIETSRSEGGTAIGDGLGLAVERLRQSDVASKVVILLTDGVQNAGVINPLKAAELAVESGIKVYCIGAGTNGFAPVPVRDPFSGRIILRGEPVEIDEQTLTVVAEKTGGRYFRATDMDALAQVYGRIDQLERSKVAEIRYLQYSEHFPRFVLSALGLLATASILGTTLLRRLP